MVQFKEITDITERKVIYPTKLVFLPHLTDASAGSKSHDEWMKQNWWMVNYQVLTKDKPKAKELALKLYEIWRNNHLDLRVGELVGELRNLRAKDYSDFTALEQWSWGAYKLNNYCGDISELEAIQEALSCYNGEVLEVMCGHHSYFDKAKLCRLVAVDYCKESLERYQHPDSQRYCCDLNQVRKGENLQFFTSNSFDVISVCFGYKYPDDIVLLMKEFHRILRVRGTLSFVESRTHGSMGTYQKFNRRKFKPNVISKELKGVGFRTTHLRRLYIEDQYRVGMAPIYHIEAVK